MLSLREFILAQWKERGIIRIGKCNNCGKCCEGNVKIYSCIGNTIELTRRVDKPCFYYNEENKTCKSYNNRCDWCSLFPYLPENLYEGCGFSFIKIEDLLEKNSKIVDKKVPLWEVPIEE